MCIVVDDWMQHFERKILPYEDFKVYLTEEEAKRLGKKDEEIYPFEANTQHVIILNVSYKPSRKVHSCEGISQKIFLFLWLVSYFDAKYTSGSNFFVYFFSESFF